MNILEQINLKFTSGNDIPVERTTLTIKEWIEIKKYLEPAIHQEQVTNAVKEIANEINNMNQEEFDIMWEEHLCSMLSKSTLDNIEEDMYFKMVYDLYKHMWK
jgi:hypothetical protein